MALETFTLEVRTDHNDPAKDKIVADMMRTHAKALLASLMLLQDKRPPQMSLMHANMFEREQEINLADDLPADTFSSDTNDNAGADTDGSV